MTTTSQTPFAINGITNTIRGALPGMHRVLNGARPEHLNLGIFDDWTGSGAPWAVAIEQTTSHLVEQIQAKFATVHWDYVGMRDMDIGEEDEYRLRGGTGADVVREQKLARRSGGGDAAETFAQTLENQLSDPGWMPDTGAIEARGVILFTTSDTKPAKHNTLENLGQELKRRGINVFIIGTPGTNMEQLATAADGFFFALDVNPTVKEAQDIASRLAATVKTTMGRMVTSRGTVSGRPQMSPAALTVGPVGKTVAVP